MNEKSNQFVAKGVTKIEILGDGQVVITADEVVVNGPLENPNVCLARQSPMSSGDVSRIKAALIESVRIGAHGSVDPVLVVESLMAAFSSLDSRLPSGV